MELQAWVPVISALLGAGGGSLISWFITHQQIEAQERQMKMNFFLEKKHQALSQLDKDLRNANNTLRRLGNVNRALSREENREAQDAYYSFISTFRDARPYLTENVDEKMGDASDALKNILAQCNWKQEADQQDMPESLEIDWGENEVKVGTAMNRIREIMADPDEIADRYEREPDS